MIFKPFSHPSLAAVLFASAVALAATAEPPAETPPDLSSDLPSDLPSEYEQLIPRGRIASVDAPEFVSADEAEISDDAWILGVAIDGEAHAYSLELLNSHEIVNDRIGDQSFAAVW